MMKGKTILQMMQELCPDMNFNKLTVCSMYCLTPDAKCEGCSFLELFTKSRFVDDVSTKGETKP